MFTVYSVTADSNHFGLIVWEDPDGVKHETTYSVEDGIVELIENDLIRD